MSALEDMTDEQKAQNQQRMNDACEAECCQLIKFLQANGMKLRKVIYAANGRPDDKTFSKEYVTGDELHFQILSNREQILKVCPNINSGYKLNELSKISDSVKLCLVLVKHEKLIRVMPHRMVYPDPTTKDAKTPKQVQLCPQQGVAPTGFYMFANESVGWRQIATLGFIIFIAFFLLLFKVWPEWLRVGVYYTSWYLIVFLIGTAIVRAIVWFAFFHFGLEIWIFPNYFIDSDNILDSFRPLLEYGLREDWRDPRMLLLRIGSAAAIVYGVQEFIREPQTLDSLLDGSTEVWNELFEWGQNKFLGIPDNNTQLDLKKSARQIYAEAFMEGEDVYGVNNKRFFDETDYSKDPAEAAAQKALEEEEAEEQRRAKMHDDEQAEEVDLDASKINNAADLLEKLTTEEGDD